MVRVVLSKAVIAEVDAASTTFVAVAVNRAVLTCAGGTTTALREMDYLLQGDGSRVDVLV